MPEEKRKPLSGNLREADIVIGVGRGIRTVNMFHRVLDFAEKIGAQVAGTRSAVDMKWVPAEREVGLSGLRIAPELYLAIGLSGANFHTIGMRQSGYIIAVNTDTKARIFRMADFCVHKDAETVLDYLLGAEDVKEREDTGELKRSLLNALRVFPHFENTERCND